MINQRPILGLNEIWNFVFGGLIMFRVPLGFPYLSIFQGLIGSAGERRYLVNWMFWFRLISVIFHQMNHRYVYAIVCPP